MDRIHAYLAALVVLVIAIAMAAMVMNSSEGESPRRTYDQMITSEIIHMAEPVAVD